MSKDLGMPKLAVCLGPEDEGVIQHLRALIDPHMPFTSLVRSALSRAGEAFASNPTPECLPMPRYQRGPRQTERKMCFRMTREDIAAIERVREALRPKMPWITRTDAVRNALRRAVRVLTEEREAIRAAYREMRA
jgi:hypothetical protein